MDIKTVTGHCCDSCCRAAGLKPKSPPDSDVRSLYCSVCGHYGIGSDMVLIKAKFGNYVPYESSLGCEGTTDENSEALAFHQFWVERNGNGVSASYAYYIGKQAWLEATRRADRKAREECAVTAWNHYVDTCREIGASAADHERWNAIDAIRATIPEDKMKNESVWPTLMAIIICCLIAAIIVIDLTRGAILK